MHGGNIYKEGDEFSKEELMICKYFLEKCTTGFETDTYFETDNFPVDEYLEFKRVTTKAKDECCPDPRTMTVYLAEEANVNLILRDPLKRPDFNWGETFCTILDNKIRIYRDTSFNIVQPILTYYKRPKIYRICWNN
ncbi:MAG: hypothetical protein CM15mV51_0370 [uncultured marine virus]|nr:MAG: hypothetical protein CM15mV51_0370 [uncultured marine virus]